MRHHLLVDFLYTQALLPLERGPASIVYSYLHKKKHQSLP